MKSEPELLAVAGRPISHSLSPLIHSCALTTGCSIRIAANSAQELLRVLKEIGVRGCNVTSPFKEEVATLVSLGDESARALEAVNTLVRHSDDFIGYNTDIVGIIGALRSVQEKVRGSRALVFGAGGAAKAVIKALQMLDIHVSISNRTIERAHAIASKFHCDVLPLQEEAIFAEAKQCALIINTLSTPEIPISMGFLNSTHVVLDAHYKSETNLVIAAKSIGATVLSGMDWLIFQGIEACKLMLGNKPSYEKVSNSLSKPKEKKSKIALIGMMGSGKTSIAKELAVRTAMSTADLDSFIEHQAGARISDIFTERGEEAFRNLESQALQQVLDGDNSIISCGGGVVLRQENRTLLESHCNVVWLWASPEALAERLKGNNERPLLAGSTPLERIKNLLQERKDFYARTSDIVIPTEGREVEEIAKRIEQEFNI